MIRTARWRSDGILVAGSEKNVHGSDQGSSRTLKSCIEGVTFSVSIPSIDQKGFIRLSGRKEEKQNG